MIKQNYKLFFEKTIWNYYKKWKNFFIQFLNAT
jgi:hypothetical protein